MVTPSGAYELGPHHGSLLVRTTRSGAAAKAGHDLLIEVQRWSAMARFGGDPADTAFALSADPASLRVLDGTGGMSSLDVGDKAGIAQTIDEEVLRGTLIRFRSTRVEPQDDGRLHVVGDLELGGRRHPIAFDVTVGDDGRVTGTAIVRQTDWGMQPYSVLFGTLKVADDVTVEIDATLHHAG